MSKAYKSFSSRQLKPSKSAKIKVTKPPGFAPLSPSNLVEEALAGIVRRNVPSSWVPASIEVIEKVNRSDISIPQQRFFRMLNPTQRQQSESLGKGRFKVNFVGYDIEHLYGGHLYKIEVKQLVARDRFSFPLTPSELEHSEVIAILNDTKVSMVYTHRNVRYDCLPGGYTLLRNKVNRV